MKNKIKVLIFLALIALLAIMVLGKSKNEPSQSEAEMQSNLEEPLVLKDVENKEHEVVWSEDTETLIVKNNYKVDMVLDDKNNTYTMQMTVNVVNDSKDVWNEIYFRDYPSVFTDKENGKVSEITEIKDERTDRSLKMERVSGDNTVFFIKLDYALEPGELASISMKYKAYIPNLNARYGYQIVGENGKDFYLGNCIPILCPYDNGKFVYHPYFEIGECFYSRMANYDVNITVPKEYTIIATGDQMSNNENEKSITCNYVANASRDFCIMIGNDYNVMSKEVDGINISSYYHSGRTKEGKEALNEAVSAIKEFNERLGKYPNNNFSVVELQMDMLGMEYPDMVLITMNEGGVESTYHEVIHQWFYSVIGNDSYDSAWIDESITTYLANPGLDDYTGIITKPYSYFENDSEYTLAMYFCGASFYNKLEEKYGKKTINSFMNEYINTYAFKEVTTQELVDLLKKYYSEDNEILKEYIDAEYLK